MTTIREAQSMVEEFQRRHGIDVGVPLGWGERHTGHDALATALREASGQLLETARWLLMWADQPRGLRAQLLVEEVGECLAALESGDEAELLDALADLLYVLLGTASTFDLPVAEAFLEVHRSNMTKAEQADRSKRILVKGPDYVPPDLARVLLEYRETQKQMSIDDDRWKFPGQTMEGRQR